MSQDKQDSVLRPSVPVRPRDTGIEVAKERNWRKRVRFCGRGFEHKYAEFTTGTGNSFVKYKLINVIENYKIISLDN